VVELKDILRDRGIKVTGKDKSELVQRLRDFDTGKEVPAHGGRGKTIRSSDKVITKTTIAKTKIPPKDKAIPTTKAVIVRSPPKTVTKIPPKDKAIPTSKPVVAQATGTQFRMLPRELRSMTLMNLSPKDLENVCQLEEFATICSDEYFQKEYFKHWYSRDKSLGVEYLKQFTSMTDHLDLLLEDINARDYEYARTALMLASDVDKKIVAILLAAGADPNIQDFQKKTALMLASEYVYMLAREDDQIEAAKHVRAEIVAILLPAGADPNIRDFHGRTALMYASMNGHTEIVEMLLAAKADVNAQNNDGSTPLMYASFHGHTDIVEMLLAAKVNVNVQSNYISTALMGASEYGHTKIVEMLLAAGADVNVKDKRLNTALMFASMNGHTDIMQLLKQYGA
jgi:ankyrin repeat protein